MVALAALRLDASLDADVTVALAHQCTEDAGWRSNERGLPEVALRRQANLLKIEEVLESGRAFGAPGPRRDRLTVGFQLDLWLLVASY